MLKSLKTQWLALPDYAQATAWILVITVALIISVALLTLWERKVIGWMQLRRGPNRVRLLGLFPGVGQPVADVFKLLLTEVIVPANANNLLFYITDSGHIATAPGGGKFADTKGVTWKGAMALKARKGGEAKFDNAKKYGIEVFQDNRTGNLIFICETGAIAVLPKH